jgi:hypothetical protein
VGTSAPTKLTHFDCARRRTAHLVTPVLLVENVICTDSDFKASVKSLYSSA